MAFSWYLSCLPARCTSIHDFPLGVYSSHTHTCETGWNQGVVSAISSDYHLLPQNLPPSSVCGSVRQRRRLWHSFVARIPSPTHYPPSVTRQPPHHIFLVNPMEVISRFWYLTSSFSWVGFNFFSHPQLHHPRYIGRPSLSSE